MIAIVRIGDRHIIYPADIEARLFPQIFYFLYIKSISWEVYR